MIKNILITGGAGYIGSHVAENIVKNNPEHLAQLAEIYLDYDSQKGFTSDTIKRKVKSEVTTNFRDSIDLLTKTKSRTKQGKSTKRKSSQSDLDALQTFLSQN